MWFASFQFAWGFVANSFLRKEQSLLCAVSCFMSAVFAGLFGERLEDLEIALQSVLRAVYVHRGCGLHPFSSLGDL